MVGERRWRMSNASTLRREAHLGTRPGLDSAKPVASFWHAALGMVRGQRVFRLKNETYFHSTRRPGAHHVGNAQSYTLQPALTSPAPRILCWNPRLRNLRRLPPFSSLERVHRACKGRRRRLGYNPTKGPKD